MNIFTRTPTNVDEALAGVTRALADLQTVEQAKVAEAESHAAAAETA
ncbi:MAG: hypothetical protein JWL91_331, partial [Sphingomonas bacterium]|nr:hypothetical protein [Sphingomonas bacterium]